MAKSFRYKDGTKVMEGTEAWELKHNPPAIMKVPNAPKGLDQHMKDLDASWRKMEGRKPVDQLTERDKMLEGRIPWDPVRLKELSNEFAQIKFPTRHPSLNKLLEETPIHISVRVGEGDVGWSNGEVIAEGIVHPEPIPFSSPFLSKAKSLIPLLERDPPINNKILVTPENEAMVRGLMEMDFAHPRFPFTGETGAGVKVTIDHEIIGLYDLLKISPEDISASKALLPPVSLTTETFLSLTNTSTRKEQLWEIHSPYVFKHFRADTVLGTAQQILDCYTGLAPEFFEAIVHDALGMTDIPLGRRFDQYIYLLTTLRQVNNIYIPFKGDGVVNGIIVKSYFHPSGVKVNVPDGIY